MSGQSYSYYFAVLILSDNEFFFFTNSHSLLYFNKINLKNTSEGWTDKMSCPSSYCYLSLSQSLLSSDKSKLYSLLSYGDYVYFCILSASDGSVISSRYKSSITSWYLYIYSATLYTDYVISIVYKNLVIYNTVTSKFTIKSFNNGINSLVIEPVSGRIITAGVKDYGYAYISKFPLGSIDAHQDFSQATWTMNELPNGVEEITSDNKKISLTPITASVSSTTLTTVSGTITLISNYTSEVYYQTQDQLIPVLRSSYVQITPDLPCSSTGTTAISYSLAEYNGNLAPSWVIINSTTGVLTLITPDVSSDTEYNFSISSSIAGVSSPILKRIKLTVQMCIVANCSK